MLDYGREQLEVNERGTRLDIVAGRGLGNVTTREDVAVEIRVTRLRRDHCNVAVDQPADRVLLAGVLEHINARPVGEEGDVIEQDRAQINRVDRLEADGARQDVAAEDDADDSLFIHGVVLEEDQVVNAVGVDIAHIAARRAKRRDVDDEVGAQRNIVLASDRHGAEEDVALLISVHQDVVGTVTVKITNRLGLCQTLDGIAAFEDKGVAGIYLGIGSVGKVNARIPRTDRHRDSRLGIVISEPFFSQLIGNRTVDRSDEIAQRLTEVYLCDIANRLGQCEVRIAVHVHVTDAREECRQIFWNDSVYSVDIRRMIGLESQRNPGQHVHAPEDARFSKDQLTDRVHHFFASLTDLRTFLEGDRENVVEVIAIDVAGAIDHAPPVIFDLRPGPVLDERALADDT